MGATSKLVRAVASIALATLVSLAGFLFVMLAPIGVFELIYGRRSVEDALGMALHSYSGLDLLPLYLPLA
jgi:hypothetical protein